MLPQWSSDRADGPRPPSTPENTVAHTPGYRPRSGTGPCATGVRLHLQEVSLFLRSTRRGVDYRPRAHGTWGSRRRTLYHPPVKDDERSDRTAPCWRSESVGGRYVRVPFVATSKAWEGRTRGTMTGEDTTLLDGPRDDGDRTYRCRPP